MRTATSPRAERDDAQGKPLEVNPRPFGAQLFAAESFAEEVRRELVQIYGEEKLMNGGLSVRTTLDPKLQIYARQALARGLITFDRKRGFRGPVKNVSTRRAIGARPSPRSRCSSDVEPWRLAVVLEVDETQANDRPPAQDACTGAVAGGARDRRHSRSRC